MIGSSRSVFQVVQAGVVPTHVGVNRTRGAGSLLHGAGGEAAVSSPPAPR